MGGIVTATLENAVSDIVYNIVNEAMLDISRNQNQLVGDIADLVFETIVGSTKDPEIGRIAGTVFSDSLEVIKEKVAEKQWKLASQSPTPPPDQD